MIHARVPLMVHCKDKQYMKVHENIIENETVSRSTGRDKRNDYDLQQITHVPFTRIYCVKYK